MLSIATIPVNDVKIHDCYYPLQNRQNKYAKYCHYSC